MALIDTEGRTIRERTGKARDAKHIPTDGLRFSEHGLAPVPGHYGSDSGQAGYGRRYLDHPSHPDPKLGGKKSIQMTHQVYGEERKRQIGKIGLKKIRVAPSEESKPRGKSGAEMRGLTSVQRAALQIKHITHQDPAALGIPMDGPSLFEAERKLEKEVRMREAQAFRESVQSRTSNRTAQLSNPTIKGPFAVEGDAEAPKYHLSRRRCPEPATGKEDAKHRGRAVDPARYQNIPVPFDTVENGNYPDPPKVGEHVSPSERRRGKGFVQGQKECQEDKDSVLRKRAESRPSIAPAQRKEDVIFGCPPPERPSTGVFHVQVYRGVGASLLDHQAEAKTERFRSGTKLVGDRYKPTALWSNSRMESSLNPEEAKRLQSKVVEAKIANELYLRRHPEVALLLSHVYREVLLRRPENPVAYIEDYLATTDLHALHVELSSRKATLLNATSRSNLCVPFVHVPALRIPSPAKKLSFMSELQTSIEVNEQLVSRCSELEKRLYDAERKAMQYQVALRDCQDEFERERAGLLEQLQHLDDVKAQLQAAEEEADRLRNEVERADLRAHETDAELLSVLRDSAHHGGGPSVRGRNGVDRFTQTEEDYEDEVTIALRNRVAALEAEIEEMDAAEAAREENRTPDGVVAEGTGAMEATVMDSPRIVVPTLQLGSAVTLSATRRNPAPGPTPRQHFQLNLATPRDGGASRLQSHTAQNFSLVTPRVIPGVQPMLETPRIAGNVLMQEATQLLRAANTDPTALARLRDSLAASNIELMTTPRNFPVPIRIPAAQPPKTPQTQVATQGSQSASPSSPPHIFDFHPREAGCPLCQLLCDVTMKFPPSVSQRGRRFLGATWVPDVCSKWKADHEQQWTLDEKGIVHSIVEARSKLRSFPVSMHEGEIFLWTGKKGLFKKPWKEAYGLVHGIFLLLFPMRNPDAEVIGVIPLRGSTINHQTLDGRANCLSIESRGCARCIKAPEGMLVESVTISLPTKTDTQRWTEALIEAQRTCPHECSGFFQNAVTLRDLIEELVRDELQ